MLSWARTSETHFATWGDFEGLAGYEPLSRIPAKCMYLGSRRQMLQDWADLVDSASEAVGAALSVK